MTSDYQTLDATVNKYAKTFQKKKFGDWYCNEMSRQLDAGVDLASVVIKLKLSMLKPLHAGWMVDLYNQMTTEDGKRIILAGWRATDILDAVRLGVANPSLTAEPISIATNLQAVSLLSEEENRIGYARSKEEQNDDADDESWESNDGELAAPELVNDEDEDDEHL